MNLDLFSAQISAMRSRVHQLRENAELAPRAESDLVDETFEAIHVTLEELRVAEEELSHQNEQLISSRQELEAERQRYRDLFDFAPDAYLTTDKYGVVREANRAAAELLRVSPQLLRGKPLAAFVPEPDRHEFRSVVNSMEAANATRHWEGRITPRHGQNVHVALAVSKAFDARRQPSGLRWMIRDLTAQKRTEEQLRDVYEKHEARVQHKTARLVCDVEWRDQLLVIERVARADAEAARRRKRDLLDSIPGVVYEADVDTGRFTFVSEYAEALLGRPSADWLLDPNFWTSVVHPDDREMVVSLRKKLVAGQRDFELEYRVIRPNGNIVWVRDVARLIAGGGGRPPLLRGVIASIQRRKRVERGLYFRKHEIESQLMDMSHLHELTLRLSSCLDLADVLEEVLKATTSLQGASMGVIWQLDAEGRTLSPACNLGLSPEFLEHVWELPVGTGSCGIAVAERRPVVVEDVETDPIFAPFLENARRAGFRAVYSTPLHVRGGEILGTLATYFSEPHRPSERQIYLVELYAQLAGQFIENARLRQKAHEAARSKDELLARVNRNLRGPLGVIDEALKSCRLGGAGAADLDEAFEIIERQARLVAEVFDELAGAARGDLAPVIGPGCESSVQTPSPEIASRELKRLVLVVGDDLDNARTLTGLLTIWGCEVRSVGTGAQALAEARERRPDVVVLDVGLSDMTGHEVARALREEFPGPMRILALTGFSHPNEFGESEPSDFDHYLVKPIDLAFLEKCLAFGDSPVKDLDL